MENDRRKQETIEAKETQKLARAAANKQKKCAELALNKKWAEQDAARATGNLAEKTKHDVQRKTEKYELACAK